MCKKLLTECKGHKGNVRFPTPLQTAWFFLLRLSPQTHLFLADYSTLLRM